MPEELGCGRTNEGGSLANLAGEAMVTCNATDVIAIQDFGYAWRINDARWDKLPAEVLERIRPLNAQRSAEVCKASSAFVNQCNLKAIEDCQIISTYHWKAPFPRTVNVLQLGCMVSLSDRSNTYMSAG